MSERIVIALLWDKMVQRAEHLHDRVVIGQRGAAPRTARAIKRAATELATLAGAVMILSRKDQL